MREALSVIPGDTTWAAAKLVNNVYSTLATCGCLVTVDEDELTVRLVSDRKTIPIRVVWCTKWRGTVYRNLP